MLDERNEEALHTAAALVPFCSSFLAGAGVSAGFSGSVGLGSSGFTSSEGS